MTSAPSTVPACITHSSVFLDPSVESDSTTRNDERTRSLCAYLHSLCENCPLLSSCLHRAVVDFEISGYCAATTASQRRIIREKLGYHLAKENFDSYVDTPSGTRVNHETIVQLRQQYPKATLNELATQAGCSLSTIKRHMRRMRSAKKIHTQTRPTPPSVEEVMETYHTLYGKRVDLKKAA